MGHTPSCLKNTKKRFVRGNRNSSTDRRNNNTLDNRNSSTDHGDNNNARNPTNKTPSTHLGSNIASTSRAGGNVKNEKVKDRLLWSKDLGRHLLGEYSFAVVQANKELEDRGQVEIGRNAIFAGVYDGHGGPDAAEFVKNNLFSNLIKNIKESGAMSEDAILRAFSATEEGFLKRVNRSFERNPLSATCGSCCLVALICSGTLYFGNLGDSRLVLGRSRLASPTYILGQQLTLEHNVRRQEIRKEMATLYPEDPEIVSIKNGVWRLKGIIQISRSIGDFYLKDKKFKLDERFPKFQIPEPPCVPLLSPVPSVQTIRLTPTDSFVILASGLWEHITNQEAARFVHDGPRQGIAKRLVEKALNKAAVAAGSTYDDIKKMTEPGERKPIHDDITVIVIYLGPDILQPPETGVFIEQVSVRGFTDRVQPSQFRELGETSI